VYCQLQDATPLSISERIRQFYTVNHQIVHYKFKWLEKTTVKHIHWLYF